MSVFNANEVMPIQQEGGQFPVGRHWVEIISADQVAVKDKNDGSWYLAINAAIVNGKEQGQVGTIRLNLGNPSEQARNIAKQHLSCICWISGRLMLNTYNDLVGAQLAIDVGTQKNNEEYTEVKKFLNFDGTAPKAGQQPSIMPAQTQQAPTQQQTQTQPATTFTPPADNNAFVPPTQEQPAQQTQPQTQPAWGGQQQAPSQTQNGGGFAEW